MVVSANLITARSENNFSLFLSHKPSVAYATKRGLIPSNVDEVEIGKGYFGCVSKIMPFGVYVQSADRL